MHSDGAAGLRVHVLDDPKCEIVNLGAVRRTYTDTTKGQALLGYQPDTPIETVSSNSPMGPGLLSRPAGGGVRRSREGLCLIRTEGFIGAWGCITLNFADGIR